MLTDVDTRVVVDVEALELKDVDVDTLVVVDVEGLELNDVDVEILVLALEYVE